MESAPRPQSLEGADWILPHDGGVVQIYNDGFTENTYAFQVAWGVQPADFHWSAVPTYIAKAAACPNAVYVWTSEEQTQPTSRREVLTLEQLVFRGDSLARRVLAVGDLGSGEKASVGDRQAVCSSDGSTYTLAFSTGHQPVVVSTRPGSRTMTVRAVSGPAGKELRHPDYPWPAGDTDRNLALVKGRLMFVGQSGQVVSVDPQTGRSRGHGFIEPQPHDKGIYAVTFDRDHLWLLTADRGADDGEVITYGVPDLTEMSRTPVLGLGTLLRTEYAYATDFVVLK